MDNSNRNRKKSDPPKKWVPKLTQSSDLASQSNSSADNYNSSNASRTKPSSENYRKNKTSASSGEKYERQLTWVPKKSPEKAQAQSTSTLPYHPEHLQQLYRAPATNFANSQDSYFGYDEDSDASSTASSPSSIFEPKVSDPRTYDKTGMTSELEKCSVIQGISKPPSQNFTDESLVAFFLLFLLEKGYQKIALHDVLNKTMGSYWDEDLEWIVESDCHHGNDSLNILIFRWLGFGSKPDLRKMAKYIYGSRNHSCSFFTASNPNLALYNKKCGLKGTPEDTWVHAQCELDDFIAKVLYVICCCAQRMKMITQTLLFSKDEKVQNCTLADVITGKKIVRYFPRVRFPFQLIVKDKLLDAPIIFDINPETFIEKLQHQLIDILNIYGQSRNSETFELALRLPIQEKFSDEITRQQVPLVAARAK